MMKQRLPPTFSRPPGAIGAGLAGPGDSSRRPPGAESPSEKIVTGHIGVGGWHRHVNNLKDRVGAICDCYEPHLQRAAKIVGRYVPLYKDFRKLLDQKDIDGW